MKTLITDIFNTFNDPVHQAYWVCEIARKSQQVIMDTEFERLKVNINWNTIEDVTAESIEELKKVHNLKVLGILLTACYRYCNNSVAKTHLIDQCLDVKSVMIYEPLYRQRQLQKKDDAAWARKKAKAKMKDSVHSENFNSSMAGLSRKFKGEFSRRNHVTEAINRCINKDQLSVDLFYQEIQILPRSWFRAEEMIQYSLLPDFIEFDWMEMVKEWAAAQDIFFKIKKYEDDKSQNNSLGFLNQYLFLFLPVWMRYNKMDVDYPASLAMFKGAYFVSRPASILYDKSYPPTLLDFMDNDYVFKNASSDSFYARLLCIRDFFETVNSRIEISGYQSWGANPILQSDIPKSNRPQQTTKIRIPSFIYPIMFQIAYLYCDVMFEINEKLLSGELDEFKYKRTIKELTNRTLINLQDLKVALDLKTNCSIYINGERKPLMEFSSGLSKLRLKVPLKSGGFAPQIMVQPLVQIAIALETGLRHQSVQWLATNFDKYIIDEFIDENELYPLWVNTDKAREKPWTAQVSGRVINYLRKLRDFRQSLDYKSWDEEIYYEGRVNSKWGKFICLFAFDKKKGKPHSDTTYDLIFKSLVFLSQEAMASFGKKVRLCTIEEVGYEKRLKIVTDLTPHSTRVTVVSEHSTFLPMDYIGKHITGQTRATVAYYNKGDEATNRQLKDQQLTRLSNISKGNTYATNKFIVKIDTCSDNSNVVKAFRANKKSAMNDYGAVSPMFGVDLESGIDIVMKDDDDKLSLGFGRFNICPYGFSCPRDIQKKGLAMRCELCPYSIQTIDHLPAIAAENHRLVEELNDIEVHVIDDDISIEELERKEIKRARLVESIGAHELSEQVLNMVRKKLKNPSQAFIANRPDIIKKSIERGDFTNKNDETGYFLERIEECIAYPSSMSSELSRHVMTLRMRLLANTGNIREALQTTPSMDKGLAEVYGIIQSLKKEHGLTNVDIAALASRQIEDVYNETKPLVNMQSALALASQ
jgi:hypothetical protein